MKILRGSSPKRISMPLDITADIDPKSEDEIENNGRAERDKRGINKIQTHSRRRDIHFFT